MQKTFVIEWDGEADITANDIWYALTTTFVHVDDEREIKVTEAAQPNVQADEANIEFFCGECGEKTVTRHRESCPRLRR